MLVLGAVDDPVAPYDAVRSLAGQLGSASLASWQSGQHGSYGTPVIPPRRNGPAARPPAGEHRREPAEERPPTATSRARSAAVRFRDGVV